MSSCGSRWRSIDVVLAILAKLVILKLGLRNISKRITSLIFLNNCTSTQHALTHNSPCFKIIDKANSKFYLKIKGALCIDWRKTNLNVQQNNLTLTLLLELLLCFVLFGFYLFVCLLVVFFLHFSFIYSLSLTLIISIFYCLNYTSLLLHLITNTL